MKTKRAAGGDLEHLILTRRDREEEAEVAFRPLEWGLLRRLWTYTRPHARKRNLLFALTITRSIQMPLLTFAMGAIISGPIANHDLGILPWAVLGYIAFAAVSDFMFHFRQRYALELGEGVVNQLRADIFAHVQSMPMSFYQRTKVGRIIGRVTSDVESVRTGIQDVLFVTTVQGGTMLIAAAIMWWCDWVLFLVVLALAPVLWLLNRHFRTKLSLYSRAASESFSRVTATLAESVNGIRVTQGFVRQSTNAGLFRQLIADHARYNISLARTSAILNPLLELNSQFFIATLLLLGGWRVFNGDMELARLIVFFFLANQFFSPIQTLGNQYNQALISMAGAERVFRLLDAKPDWTEPPEVRELPDPRRGRDGANRTGGGVRVEFRDVHFGYDPRRPVLHGISFTVEPDQSVALVGHTGSGKSTIVGLAAKFYLPTAGAVLVDGHDLNTISGSSLHRQMGSVQQQNFLFSGTVAENIRLGRPEASDAEVETVLRQLDCLDLILALPGGLHAPVGERGGSLSLGVRQVVCFARALIADPRLLIFDEATSAIDTLTEARLQKALVRLLRGRTSFVVAHRLSTIRQVDQIMVLDHGRIVERGRHEQLLAANGPYAELYRQFAHQSRAGA